MRISYRPTMISAFCAVFVAMSATLSGVMAEALQPLPGFLEMARDADATPARKITIAAMLDFAKEDDPERAYKKLKETDTMVFYGGEYFLSDLSPLAEFTQLKTLVLYNHHIEDLAPLAFLTKLETLRLEINRIKDISALAKLENLESLQIDDNQISDLRPLAGLEKLRTLWIDRNKVADVSALSELMDLRNLFLSGNRVLDLKPLTGLALCDLRLAANGISDLSDLRHLNQKTTCFISLDLADNAIVDVEPIGQLERVVSINLSGNKISDISPLKNSELGDLDLKNNKVADFSHLRKMDSLGRVDVSGNPIKDFSELLALKSENTELEIVGGEPFEEAYRKSIPVKKELADSPLLGIWRTEVQESEWGAIIIEMRFEPNGICYLNIRSGDPEEEGEMSTDGLFSIERNNLKQTVHGEESMSEFKVEGEVLTLTHEGESTVLKKVVK